MSGFAIRLKLYSKSLAVRSVPSLHFRPSRMVKVQVRPSSLASQLSAWPPITSLFSLISSRGSKMVMMVLEASIAEFRAGSRVSGLGPYWTVKPAVLTLPVEEPAAEEAEPEVAVEPDLLPPQAARPRAAAPTPATLRKLRREMRFIIIILPLNQIECARFCPAASIFDPEHGLPKQPVLRRNTNSIMRSRTGYKSQRVSVTISLQYFSRKMRCVHLSGE